MSDMAANAERIGRGAAEGKRLFREWFDGLSAAATRGEKVAYVFVMGSLVEILRCFDLHVRVEQQHVCTRDLTVGERVVHPRREPAVAPRIEVATTRELGDLPDLG